MKVKKLVYKLSELSMMYDIADYELHFRLPHDFAGEAMAVVDEARRRVNIEPLPSSLARGRAPEILVDLAGLPLPEESRPAGERADSAGDFFQSCATAAA
jgi:hypothetical protein